MVLDKITPENIELCDMLKWDNDNLYLIHVKSGFGNTMRDLCAQISISANRLVQDRKATPSKEFVKKVYQSLKNKNGGEGYYGLAGAQTNNMMEDEFLELFDKQKHFVLAILDTSTSERELQNIEEFNSNIAKFSLDVLTKEMAGIGQNLQIGQIKKGAN